MRDINKILINCHGILLLTIDMTIEEIEDLLLIISDKSDNNEAAVSAFRALYKGYSEFVQRVVSGALKVLGIYEEHLMETVVSNTFFKLYEKPLAFSFPAEAIDEKCFRAWLSTVARNDLKTLLKDYFGTERGLGPAEEEALTESEEISDDLFESVNLKMMNDALNTLSERDKDILMTLYLYHDEGRYTPSEKLQILCNLHNTTKDNIRQIKKRSEAKIIKYFSDHSELKPIKNVK